MIRVTTIKPGQFEPNRHSDQAKKHREASASVRA